jgi:hypothetical protein
MRSRDRLRATGYGLDDRESILGEGKRFSLLHSVQIGF